MSTCEESNPFFVNMQRALSKVRFDSYRNKTGTNTEATCRYLWNTALCEALYPSFQILEVSFRNAVHAEISTFIKDTQWLKNEIGFLYEDEKKAITDAKQTLSRDKKPLTEDLIIAEMKFGFWTSLLDTRYDKLWHKIIAGVFPTIPRRIRTRGDVSVLMNKVRRLRNAASHHHSIWHWSDLEKQHSEMQQLIGWICTSMAELTKKIDRFPEVYRCGHTRFESIVRSVSECSHLEPGDGLKL